MNHQKKDISPVQRFWRLLKPDAKEIRNIYTYAIFNGLISLSLPLGIQAIVNLIQGGSVSSSWIVLVVFVVLGVAITGLLQIYQLRITENLQQNIFSRAAFEFTYRLPKIKIDALLNRYAPELMNRFFDVMTIQKGISKILIDFSAAILQVIFGLILLSFYHSFFIMFSVILVLMVFFIFVFTAKKGLETSLEESKYKYKTVHWLEEMARTANSFKLIGHSNLSLEKVDGEVGNYLKARESHFSILVQQYSLMVVFKVLVATGLLAIGGILVMEQSMNIGQFIAAEIIILIVMNSVEKLIVSLETIYDVLTSLEKIGEITDLELESDEGMDLESVCGDQGLEVALDGFGFKFPGSPDFILRDLNMHIRPSEKVLVTGPNGSGKSTLLHAIAGLYELEHGSITYQGIPLGNFKTTSIRKAIGGNLDEEELFEGTLYENISMGRDEVDLDQIQWAFEKLGLLDFLKGLPKGYDTMVNTMGKRFPKSVVQKLLLARSIVSKPRLLLIEDSLEHIDPLEKERIAKFLFDASNSWTLIMTSSDPEMVGLAQREIKLKS